MTTRPEYDKTKMHWDYWPARVAYPVPGEAIVTHERGPTHPNVALTVARLRAQGLAVTVPGAS